MKTQLQRAPIFNYSGWEVKSHPTIEDLRQGYFQKVTKAIAGEAPKDFIRVYEYGDGRRANPRNWPGYIAKVGIKWYPNESITEHLLTRLGQVMGAPVTPSRLMWVHGQLRFLSRYFLRREESLVHGAEIFAEHLGDREFVEEVEDAKLSRNVFTFQVVDESIRNVFPDQADEIMVQFVRLLQYDAIVGNNDRHFYNWGVITDLKGRRPPRFSPIYDTARALFWNTSEENLERTEKQKNLGQFMTKYVDQSLPKTGWDGLDAPNHFDLIEAIYRSYPQYQPILEEIDSDRLMPQFETLLDEEFSGLLSSRRTKFVLGCLKERIEQYLARLR